MKKSKVICLAIVVAVLILEILPFGAALNFMGDPEANITVRHTYSYFDLTPFGYANFGPLLTAIFTCVLTILLIISANVKSELKAPITAVSVIATLTSLMPLLYGLRYFTFVGLLITLGLGAVSIINLKK